MTITIKVKPNAKRTEIAAPSGDELYWKVSLKSPPSEGKANEELIEVLSKHFHVPKSRVEIKKGITGRMKVVEIS